MRRDNFTKDMGVGGFIMMIVLMGVCPILILPFFLFYSSFKDSMVAALFDDIAKSKFGETVKTIGIYIFLLLLPTVPPVYTIISFIVKGIEQTLADSLMMVLFAIYDLIFFTYAALRIRYELKQDELYPDREQPKFMTTANPVIFYFGGLWIPIIIGVLAHNPD